MKYSYDQLNKIANSMALGAYGSFANHIGDAFLVADIGNREILFKAFEELFDKVANISGIKSTIEREKA
jgi:hypothetical protein